jgi:hypothetical protein
MKPIVRRNPLTGKTRFEGGYDTVTPVLDIPPGRLRSSKNVYQDINGGYRTLTPYERFDGRASPSDAVYSILTVSLSATVSVNDVVTDGAGTGTVIALAGDESYLVLSKVSGTFGSGSITVGGTPKGTCTGPQVESGAATSLLDAQYANLAADLYRADITAVPGSGDTLGIHYFNNTAYAFRNNAGGTAEQLYKSSGSGWTLVSLGYEMSFTSGGAHEVIEGDTIKDNATTNTAVVARVILESGSWAGADAAGRFIFTAEPSGVFTIGGQIDEGANADVATVGAASWTAITLANPSGRFEIIDYNFTGNTDTKRMYGVDGVNRGFEFDGSVFCPIETGMANDTPTHIMAHKYQLFFSYYGSAQYSAPGKPYEWNILSGGNEIGLGDTITSFITQPGGETGGAAAILSKNQTGILYGNNIDDFELVEYKNNVGAIEWSVQRIGSTFMLDSAGVINLSTAQEYGNFADAIESNLVSDWIAQKKTQVTASCIVKDKNQYWIFFADKTALCATVVGGRIAACMPMSFPDKITCAFSGEDNSGNEIILLGDEDGFVHQLYKGTSFDGDAISWLLETSFDHQGSPLWDKEFMLAMLEASGTGYAEFEFGHELGYASTDINQPSYVSEALGLSGGSWDGGGSWDSGNFDVVGLSPSYFRLNGDASNISFKLKGESDYNQSLLFSGIMYLFLPTIERR